MPAKKSRGSKRPFGNMSKRKARKTLRHGTVHGKRLSKAQKRALGARAGGS